MKDKGTGSRALTQALTISLRIRDEDPDAVIAETMNKPKEEIADILLALAAAININESSKVLLARVEDVKAGSTTNLARWVKCGFCGEFFGSITREFCSKACAAGIEQPNTSGSDQQTNLPGFDESAVQDVLSGRMPVRISTVEIDEVIGRLVGDGLTDTEIARRTGMSRETVARRCQRLGLPPASKRVKAVGALV